MTELQTFLLTLLSAAGVSAALSGFVVWLSKEWLTERLRGSIKHEYDLKLAAATTELKSKADTQAVQLAASIETQAEKLRVATSSLGESQKVAIARKLDAIDTLWSGVLVARENVPIVMGFIDILSEDEYLSMADHPHFQQMVGEISPEKMAKMFKDNVGSLERVRPYVGEPLWAVFSTYQAIVTRTALLVQMGEKDPNKLNWHQDHGIRQLLAASLTAEEIAQFDATPLGKIGWLQRNYEGKILQAMGKVISGKEFSEEALAQAQAMEEKIQELNAQNA